MRALASLSLAALLWAPLAAFAGSPGNNWPDLSVPAPTQGGGEKDVALIIGISDYSDLADIPGAADNAREWATYLTETRKLDPVNVFTVLDKEAIVETIRLKLENAVAATKDGGTLWVIYIGHGYSGEDENKNKSGLLVGQDARPVLENMKNRSLSQDYLFKQISKGKQAQSVVLLDACFSGKTPAGKPLLDTGLQVAIIADDPDDIIKRQVTPKKQKGLVVLTATDKDEYAGPLPGTKKPAFSYLILGAMRGWASNGDGTVTADEALEYSASILRQAPDRKQTPQLKGKTKGSFVLSKGSEERPSPSFEPLVEEALVGEVGAVQLKIEMVKIKVSSDPEGSAIFVNNLSRAVTPAELEFPKSEDAVKLRVSRDGYEPQEIEVSLNESQEKSFALKALPPVVLQVPTDQPEQNNKPILVGALATGAVGTGVASLLVANAFCREGDFKGGAAKVMYALPVVSGVLGGSAWMSQSAEPGNLLAPSLGATGAMLLLSGAQYATYKCLEPPPNQGQPVGRNAKNDALLGVGLGLMGAAVVDFAIWGVVYAKHKKQPEAPTKTTLNFSPLTSGGLLQLRTSW